MNVVVDSSVLVAAVVGDGPHGTWAEAVMESHQLYAPDLVLVEATNVLRRLERAKLISTFEANSAFDDLLQLAIEPFAFAPFADRIWQLRNNMTSYDAWYVALAEALDIPLATLDRPLSRARNVSCKFLTP